MIRIRRFPGCSGAAPPGRLIDAAQEHRIELASSAALLAELQGVSDPADDHVLAAALAAQADLIASGDAHLLDLGNFHGIEIVTAAVAVERIG